MTSVLGTYEATLAAARNLCSSMGRPRVLDVGCGDGTLLTELAPEVDYGLGIDASPEAVASATAESEGVDNVAFRALAIEELNGVEAGRFDLALFVGSLEHIEDPRAALEAAGRHLRPGGRIMVVAISPTAPHAVISRRMLKNSECPVVEHLGADGLVRLAPRAGLRVEEVRPLRRGPREGGLVGSLLSLYDRVAGATCAVTLVPDPPEGS